MRIFVKPTRPDLVIRDPGNLYRPIDPQGTSVEDSTYWQRRIADGDAVEIDEPADVPPPAAMQETTSVETVQAVVAEVLLAGDTEGED